MATSTSQTYWMFGGLTEAGPGRTTEVSEMLQETLW